jgi:hypothetical protein
MMYKLVIAEKPLWRSPLQPFLVTKKARGRFF